MQALSWIDYVTWSLAAVSLIATYLNTKKRTECFFIWAFTNSAWTLYDFSINAYAQAALMLAYVVLAFYGIYEWRKGGKHPRCAHCGR
jgi:nicotinamide riboside transporter PnuC